MPCPDLDACRSKNRKISEKKLKKHKKEKRSKEKKQVRLEVDKSSCKRSSSELQRLTEKVHSDKDQVKFEKTFGPALPPHLLNSAALPKIVIGPQLLTNLITISTPTSCSEKSETISSPLAEDEVFGPNPLDACPGKISLRNSHLELEQRALELKIAALDNQKQNIDQKEREEWMLELPEVGLKGGLAALSNLKRKFHHGKERPDFSDRSEWTKTPQSDSTSSLKTASFKATSEKLRADAQTICERQYDKQQEDIAKKHKRTISLVDIHQKKLQVEQKEKERIAATKGKLDRRPFSREVDLKLSKIDKSQTKAIVDKAKILNTKFASGQTKYL